MTVGRRRGEERAFDEFVRATEGRVRRALVPVAGVDAAHDATVDALVHVWSHWERVAGMSNPSGYLYRVARSRIRYLRPLGEVLGVDVEGPSGVPDVEPRLVGALAALPERQRVVVYLVHACEWRYTEVADLLDLSVSTVRNHADRGLSSLRRELEVPDVH